MPSNKRDQVFEAADALAREGVKVTNNAVRERMGSGVSESTLQKYLPEWRTLNESPALSVELEGLPAAVARSFRTVWEEAVHAGHQAALDELAEFRTTLQNQTDQATATAAAAEGERETIQQDMDLLQERLTYTEEARQGAIARVEALETENQQAREQHSREIHALTEDRNSWRSECEASNERADKMKSELETRIAALEAALEAAQSRYDADTEAQLRTIERERQAAETLRQQVQQLHDQAHQSREALLLEKKEHEHTRAAQNRSDAQWHKAAEQAAAQELALKELREEASAERRDARSAIDRAETRVERFEADNRRLSRELEQAWATIAQLRGEKGAGDSDVE